jgi:putative lipoprotein
MFGGQSNDYRLKRKKMKHIIKYIAYSTLCAVALLVSSCDTDVEPVKINQSGIEHQNPELYKNYLAGIRAYKASNHKVMMAWFDNSQTVPFTQAQHINAVPDSVDYVVLTNPGMVTEQMMQEIAEVRSRKGTKVVFQISFDALKMAYETQKKAFMAKPENANKKFRDFNGFLVDTVNTQLHFIDKYNYDGVIMDFNAKLTYYLTDAEKAEAIALENDFLGISKDWKERHKDKELIMMGRPQHVTDKSLFAQARYLVIPTQDEKSVSGVDYLVRRALVEGVPTDKFVVLANNKSIDETDTKTGYWGKSLAMYGIAKYVASDHTGYTCAGMGLLSANVDYYNASFTYPNLRKVISIINPTVKE